jgi:thioredoxin 1
MIDVTNDNLNDIIKTSTTPVLVDFWAEWCGPCIQLSPILKAVAEENPQILVVKCDVDQNKQTAQENGILGLPTLNYYINGELRSSIVGLATKNAINSLIEATGHHLRTTK